MNIPISPRLLACARLVRPGDRVADIGCDHGYLSIYLLKNGIARSCIAADIKKMPLQSAMRNANKFGIRANMQFFLADGVQGIPRDFDCMVCAGMGGDTMISILQAAPWLQNPQYRLILQCQSKTPLLRQYLSDSGWHIARENLVRDGKFLYTVMEILWQPESPRLTPAQTYLTPALLQCGDPELTEYAAWVINGLKIAVSHRSDPELTAILEDLKNLPCLKEETQ